MDDKEKGKEKGEWKRAIKQENEEERERENKQDHLAIRQTHTIHYNPNNYNLSPWNSFAQN